MDSSDEARRKLAAEEAFEWLRRLERTLHPHDSAPLREWLRVPLHRQLILDRCRLLHGPEVLAILSELIPKDVQRAQATQRPRSMRAAIATAAALTLVTVLVMTGWTRWLAPELPPHLARAVQMYQTPVGARQRVTLADGSTMTLNTGSQVFVQYGPRWRDVALITGEVSFDVTYDVARPFRVNAGGRVLEAEGAVNRFNVHRLSDDRAEVTVSEGQVRALYTPVREPITPAQLRTVSTYGEVSLQAMESGIVGPGWQSVGRLEPERIQAELAWQQGSIFFADMPLEHALGELERYTIRRFVLGDARLRNVRLTAQVSVDDMNSFLSVLREHYDVVARTDAHGQTVLMPVATL